MGLLLQTRVLVPISSDLKSHVSFDDPAFAQKDLM